MGGGLLDDECGDASRLGRSVIVARCWLRSAAAASRSATSSRAATSASPPSRVRPPTIRATQTYTIVGAGTNMWATRDEFQFAWRKMTGDFIVRTHAALQGTGVDPHRKIGWIIRKTLDADSPYVDVAVHGDGLTSLQFRKTAGAITEQVQSTVKGADVIQLARKGRTYTMSVARFGDTFTHNEVADIDLGDEVYVGLFVCSHNPAVSERAVFKNVRIVVPPKEGWVPYRDYIGSNLEVMDVATGDRTVVCNVADLGAGAELDARRQGADLQQRGQAVSVRPRQPHDHAARHRLCDARTTTTTCCRSTARCSASAISRPRSSGDRWSTRCRSSGGTPKRITANSPSYLHGWSPDAKLLVYTGGRNGEFDIYKIPVDGGEEIRLTTTTGLDDGPEYSPDGQWIYFNSIAQRPDADLADEAGRQRPGAAHERRVQQLVPAPVAGRQER